MFATPAYAQAAQGASSGGPADMLIQFAPIILMFVAGYFFLIRPQQQRAKAHQEQLKGIQRGDTVVLSNGMIGKIMKVEDAEVSVEISPKVEVKVVKSMISDVRTRGVPAVANDAKA